MTALKTSAIVEMQRELHVRMKIGYGMMSVADVDVWMFRLERFTFWGFRPVFEEK